MNASIKFACCGLLLACCSSVFSQTTQTYAVPADAPGAAPIVTYPAPTGAYIQQQPQVVVTQPPPTVVAVPPGVVYVAPAYPAPAVGFVWAYHPRFGWGWRHPSYGWHRGWR